MTTAVVVTYNSAGVIRNCLQALDGVAVVVVDNASTDGTSALVRQDFPHVQLIERDRNGGFAVGVNDALRMLPDEDVMLVNPDLKATTSGIAILENHLRGHPSVGIAAPRLVYPGGAIQESARTFPSPLKVLARRSPFGRTPWGRRLVASYLMTDEISAAPRAVDFVIGAAMLVRRAAIREVGGMDERLFLYGEDVDWCYRMWAKGWEVQLVPAAVMEHRYERASRRSLDFRSVAVRHHWASMLKVYGLHPRLLLGWGPPSPRAPS
jgi:N-acetylglucosaminyl-diphospho-decaprenol L-rhamnosyltransferase